MKKILFLLSFILFFRFGYSSEVSGTAQTNTTENTTAKTQEAKSQESSSQKSELEKATEKLSVMQVKEILESGKVTAQELAESEKLLDQIMIKVNKAPIWYKNFTALRKFVAGSIFTAFYSKILISTILYMRKRDAEASKLHKHINDYDRFYVFSRLLGSIGFLQMALIAPLLLARVPILTLLPDDLKLAPLGLIGSIPTTIMGLNDFKTVQNRDYNRALAIRTQFKNYKILLNQQANN